MNLNQNNEIINDMNIMNMNNFQPMMFNQFNNNLNKDELMINLINQNSQMTNQIAINNNILKSLMQNPMKSKLDLSEINFFPRYKGEIINIFFQDNTGIKINIATPYDAQMKDLLTIFHIRLQIYGLENKKKIYELKAYTFLYNSQKISLDEKASIFDYGLKNKLETIVFFLKNNMIGG